MSDFGHPRPVVLYVLELEDNYYYVGTTTDVDEWYAEHVAGRRGAWTRMHTPLGIDERDELGSNENPGIMEDSKVIALMRDFGIENVRGGSFSSVVLSKHNLATLRQMIRHANNACFRCGSSRHYVNECDLDESVSSVSDIDYYNSDDYPSDYEGSDGEGSDSDSEGSDSDSEGSDSDGDGEGSDSDSEGSDSDGEGSDGDSEGSDGEGEG